MFTSKTNDYPLSG